MKAITLLVTLTIALFFVSATYINANRGFTDTRNNINDSLIKVNVQLEDVPGGTAYCGIIMFKGNYKFKLIGPSRYLVTSKDDFIKIQFTCPRETMAGMITNSKYTFFIKPLYNAGKAERLKEDSIPVYTYAKFY